MISTEWIVVLLVVAFVVAATVELVWRMFAPATRRVSEIDRVRETRRNAVKEAIAGKTEEELQAIMDGCGCSAVTVGRCKECAVVGEIIAGIEEQIRMEYWDSIIEAEREEDE